MYDPKIGRFLQRDPIGLKGNDNNIYRYENNNPVTFLDPLGEDCKCNPRKPSLLKGIPVLSPGTSKINPYPGKLTPSHVLGGYHSFEHNLSANQTVGPWGNGSCVGVALIPSDPSMAPIIVYHFTAGNNPSEIGNWDPRPQDNLGNANDPGHLQFNPFKKFGYTAVLCGSQVDCDPANQAVNDRLLSKVITALRILDIPIRGYVPGPSFQVNNQGDIFWDVSLTQSLAGFEPSGMGSNPGIPIFYRPNEGYVSSPIYR